ncbi:unnamed protein product [Polarella glacialis]|uniref:Uncharacterized protein n=1 Tax=Polarella glacialis TaxID=89957 RepID=A0A813FUA9_POLGL|nr:unnamed protein product [Polarella glacialis]
MARLLTKSTHAKFGSGRRSTLVCQAGLLCMLLLGAATAAASRAFMMPGRLGLSGRPPYRVPSALPRRFFGSSDAGSDAPKSRQGSKVPKSDDVTVADKMKELWEDPSLRTVVQVVSAGSLLVDIFGFVTGEAGISAGLVEALGSADVTALGEAASQAPLEDMADAGGPVQALQESAESILSNFPKLR